MEGGATWIAASRSDRNRSERIARMTRLVMRGGLVPVVSEPGRQVRTRTAVFGLNPLQTSSRVSK